MTIQEIQVGDKLQAAHSSDTFRVLKVNKVTVEVKGPVGPAMKLSPDIFVRKV